MTELETDTPVSQVQYLYLDRITDSCQYSRFGVLILGRFLFYREIMIVCTHQPLLSLRTIWSFWLNAWMIYLWNSKRCGLFYSLVQFSHPELSQCDISFSFFPSSNITTGTFLVSKHNSKPGSRREGRSLDGPLYSKNSACPKTFVLSFSATLVNRSID